MIEVEKKFILTESDIGRLTADAEFIGEKIFTDVYYDTPDHSLTTKDHWLRLRDGRPELKVPMSEVLTRAAEQYEELEEEKEIRNYLKLPPGGTFEEVLLKNGFEKFCVCTTTRKKYKRDKFIIDLDEVAYSEFNYKIGEIELLVKDKSEMEAAANDIIAFAKQNNLKLAKVRGKVIEYLKRVRPEHYKAMVEAKVVLDY